MRILMIEMPEIFLAFFIHTSNQVRCFHLDVNQA